MYLGEKTNKFMPNNDLKSKSELYSWLMFVATGIGPYSGQSVHFLHMAPEKIKYAINRYIDLSTVPTISIRVLHVNYIMTLRKSKLIGKKS